MVRKSQLERIELLKNSSELEFIAIMGKCRVG